MTDTQLTKSKKFRMVILTGCITAACHAIQVYYPEFPADEMAGYAIKIFAVWITAHTITDTAREFKVKE